MLEFEIIAHGLYRPQQLVIDYDPTQCMPITPKMQLWMDDLWQQQLTLAKERNKRLIDTSLFRYVSATCLEDGTLHLILGNTSYKEYVTSRTPEFAHAHARQDLGNPLAVCSVIETSDNYILLDKRQAKLDVYAGRYHVIGGFFERALDTTTHPDPFFAMQREIREETGIWPTDIAAQYSLGVVYDLTTPHAEMCFLTQLTISLADVLQERTPEEDEIKELHPLQATPKSLQEFIITHHGNISATGEPNLLLYGEWKFGKMWFDETIMLIM